MLFLVRRLTAVVEELEVEELEVEELEVEELVVEEVVVEVVLVVVDVTVPVGISSLAAARAQAETRGVITG